MGKLFLFIPIRFKLFYITRCNESVAKAGTGIIAKNLLCYQTKWIGIQNVGSTIQECEDDQVCMINVYEYASMKFHSYELISFKQSS